MREELNPKSSKIAEGEESVTFADGEEQKTETTKIKLKTSDGVIFEVEPWIVKEMKTVQSFIDSNDDTNNNTNIIIPLLNVTSHNLGQIIELKLKEFDKSFVKTLSHKELQELLIAANYLNMNTVLQFMAKAIADIIKDKSVEFVRNFFGIQNDYTPEEETHLREANSWAFEDDH